MTTNPEALRAKIAEAVSEKDFVSYNEMFEREPVQLADVLRATPDLWAQPKTDSGDNKYRYITNGIFSTGIKWNLAANLDDQPQEVIDLLHKILCV